jgi:hypothetical protein
VIMRDSYQNVLNRRELLKSQGGGIASGVLAIAVCHWMSGMSFGLMLAFVYGLTGFRMRGWKELCSLVTIMGTFVTYFAIYESFKQDMPLILSIGLSVAAVGLYIAYINAVVSWVIWARAKILVNKWSISISDAMALPLSDTEHWLEPIFALMRARKTTKELSLNYIIRGFFVLTILLGVAGLLLPVWFDNKLLAAIGASVFLFAVVVGARFVRYFGRLVQPSTNEVLASDPRPPILLLRPFTLDELQVTPFDEGGLPGVMNFFNAYNLTFEQVLTNLFKDIGPVIAIGRPGEEVAPLGAARGYADNASWQRVVLDLAETSQLVIMILDTTPGMQWELENVPKQIGLSRVGIVLPPEEDFSVKRSVDWYKKWIKLQEKFVFLPDVSEHAVGVLFDDNGAPIVVTAKGSTVPQQIAAIKDAWIKKSVDSTTAEQPNACILSDSRNDFHQQHYRGSTHLRKTSKNIISELRNKGVKESQQHSQQSETNTTQACQDSALSKQPTKEDVSELLSGLLKPNGREELMRSLRPKAEDYKAVYKEPFATILEEAHREIWESDEIIGGNPGQDEIQVFLTTSDNLIDHTPLADLFPGGYRDIDSYLKPGVPIATFKFVKPGLDYGMAYDGLVYVNRHWVFMPKPWHALYGGDE